MILKKVFMLLVLLLVICLLSVVAWSKEIVIGFTGPLSGPAAEYGFDCIKGINIGIKKVNESGGIKIKGETYTLRLEKLDDQIDPTRAVINARRLKEQHGAVAVFEPVGGLAHAIMGINQEKMHEFLVMAYTSTPSTAKMGNKLTIILPPPLSIYAQVFAKWCEDKAYQRAGILLNNDSYGTDWKTYFTKYFRGTIASVQSANYYKEIDYTAQISAILATKPDVMLIGGPSPTTALVIEQARSMGYKGAFVLIDQAKLDYVKHILKGTVLLENVIAVAMVDSLPSPVTPWVKRTLQENYKGLYNWEISIHFGAVLALARAIAAAGTPSDVWAIRKSFPRAYPIGVNEAPSPVFGLSPEGIQLMPASVQSVKDGKISKPRLPIWWVKNKKEFDNVVKALHLDPKMADCEFMPLEF